MLDLIKLLINYIPRGSVDDMLEAKLASLAAFESEKIEATGLDELSETSPWPTIEMKVVENQVKKSDLKKTKHVEDILRDILDTFEKDYKEGKNYHENFTISKKEENYSRRVIMLMQLCSNSISANSRIGPGNVVILPKDIYEMEIGSVNFAGLTPVCNPLDGFDDKIFVIRREGKGNEHSQKYHLLTDNNMPNDREMKINKILDTELEEIREITYAIMSVHGHKETVAVINIV